MSIDFHTHFTMDLSRLECLSAILATIDYASIRPTCSWALIPTTCRTASQRGDCISVITLTSKDTLQQIHIRKVAVVMDVGK
jgi:hypothetical protein